MSAISSLHKSLPLVAAAYGQKMGVKVAIGSNGSDAYTDGQTIVLPNISTDKYPKEILWGYLAHEAAHIRYTDFTVHRDPGVHAALTNIIEDARIEREMVKAYPGVKADLDAIWQYLRDAGYIQDVSPDTPPAGIIQMYCLYFLRCQQLGQAILKDSLAKAETALEAAFPKEVCIRLRGILHAISTISSTMAAAIKAREILEMLKDEKEQQEQEHSGTPSESAADSNLSDGEIGGAGDEASAEQQQRDSGADFGDEGESAQAVGNTDGDARDTEAGEGADVDDANGAFKAEDSDSNGEADTDAFTNIKSVLDAGSQDLALDPMDQLRRGMYDEASGRDQPYATVELPSVHDAAFLDDKQHNLPNQMLDHVRATSAKLQNRLLGLVEATQRQPARPARRGRRIDTKRLSRIATGDTRVFRGRHDVKAPNAAVHVLVDMSGSMFLSDQSEEAFKAQHGRSLRHEDVYGSKTKNDVDSRERLGYTAPFQVARNATLALSQALGRIKGVNVGATAFSNGVMPMLHHGESINEQTVQRFKVTPSGSTALAEALLHCGMVLSQTREARKVLIVLSDGEPDDAWTTRYMVDQLSGAVEMVGIGIQHNAIAHYIKNSTIVNDLGDLETTLMDVARASILNAY